MKKFLFLLLFAFAFVFPINVSALDRSVTELNLVVFSDFENPLTSDFIISSVDVNDTFDGNLSSSAIVLLNDYIGHETSLGVYSIDLQVTDSHFNVSNVFIEVRVVDISVPVFDGIIDVVLPLNIGYDFFVGVTAFDNYDNEMTESILIDSTAVDYTTYGEYEVIYTVTDSSGNIATQIASCTIKDVIFPVFNGVSSVIKTTGTVVLITDLIDTFEVYDNLLGNMIDDIYVITDFYSGFGDKAGNYIVLFGVTDNFDNETTFQVDITVTNTIPVNTVLFDFVDLYVPNDYLLTDLDLLNFVKLSNDLDPTKDYAMTYGSRTYFDSYDVLGSYVLPIRVVSNSGLSFETEFTISVVPSVDYSFNEGSDGGYFQFLADLPVWIGVVLGLVCIGGLAYAFKPKI